MTYAPTVAEGWETIRTDRPLVEIAEEQADSRVLSTDTRAYFAHLVNPGAAPVDGGEHYGYAARERAFFEAAASYSTRKGQSYARRVALGDLHRLHEAVMSGKPIPRTRYYATGLPATVSVAPDGKVTVHVDVTEASAAVADSAQPGALVDSLTVATAVTTHTADIVEA